MASPTTSVLTREQIAKQLRSMPGWQVQGNELVKPYRFKNFLEAVDFVDKITPEAEAAGHHPQPARPLGRGHGAPDHPLRRWRNREGRQTREHDRSDLSGSARCFTDGL